MTGQPRHLHPHLRPRQCQCPFVGELRWLALWEPEPHQPWQRQQAERRRKAQRQQQPKKSQPRKARRRTAVRQSPRRPWKLRLPTEPERPMLERQKKQHQQRPAGC